MAVDQTRERLVAELTGPLLAMGLDLEAVEITPAGRRRVLRVAVDTDGGVTLDDVAAATQEISRVLDTADLMGEQSDGRRPRECGPAPLWGVTGNT